MSICRQHEQRDPIGDVSELLRPLRFERAPGPKQVPVTPDQYRQWQEKRAAEGVAGVKASGHVNAPHVQPPMALDAIAKKPGEWFDAAVKAIPESIRKAPFVGHNYGGSAGIPAQSKRSDLEHNIRGAATFASPVDLSPNATPESQIVHGALALAPLLPARGIAQGTKAAVGALARDARAAGRQVAERGVVNSVKDLSKSVGEALGKLRPKAKPAPQAAAPLERGAWEVSPHWSGQNAGKAAAEAVAPKRGIVGNAVRAATWPARKVAQGIGWAVRNPMNASWAIPQGLRVAGGIGALGWVGYEAVKRGLSAIDKPEPELSPPPGKDNPVLRPLDKREPIKREDFDGRKMLGPKGEIPGNDAQGNALPNVRPEVPHKAEYAPSLAALSALGNDADMNALRYEYAVLERKVRMLQERGLPPEAAMRPDEIRRWSELNSPGFQTPGGNSIFKGRR